VPSLGKVSLSHGDASPEMVCSVVAKVGGTCTDACHHILSGLLRCALPIHMGGDTTCVTFSCDVATMPGYGTSAMDAAISISGIVTTLAAPRPLRVPLARPLPLAPQMLPSSLAVLSQMMPRVP
jgi:hypothetical protein